MRPSILRVLVLAPLLLGTLACGDDETTPTTDPTPARQQITEPPFEGTLTVNGARTHPFTATGSGEIRVTLTALSPDSTARVGVSLGIFNATQCQIVIANDSATQGAIVLGNAGAAGNFCVRVHDVGQLTAPTDYSVTVVHF
jgi:hypothetical protein